jgi:predicted glycosyltransferase involved in capsule biosynthesis
LFFTAEFIFLCSKISYSLQGYFGGISVVNTDHVKLINGFSNQYWGWGGEDGDLLRRLRLMLTKILFIS